MQGTIVEIAESVIVFLLFLTAVLCALAVVYCLKEHEWLGVDRKKRPLSYWAGFSAMLAMGSFCLLVIVFERIDQTPAIARLMVFAAIMIVSVSGSILLAVPLVGAFRTGVVEGKRNGQRKLFQRAKEPVAFWMFQTMNIVFIGMALALGVMGGLGAAHYWN